MGQLNQAIQIENTLNYYEIENFVETGTGAAEVVRDISEINDKLNVHTIEIIPEIYDKNAISYSYLNNVTWHLGKSSDILPEIVSKINTPTLFWLDAHFPGADFGLASYGDEPDLEKRLPLKSELEKIVSNKDVTNDVFVIDDLRIYEDGPFEDGSWEDRTKYGGDGIEFIDELFEDSHYVVKSYNKQGFIILFPLNKDIDNEVENLLVGSVE